MRFNPGTLDPATLAGDITAYRSGQDAAGDRLAAALHPVLQTTAAGFLGPDHPDVDDVVQDATLSSLGYFRQADGFTGDPIRLAVTIARNRCRDLHRWRASKPQTEITSMQDWLESDVSSSLQDMLKSEESDLLQQALNSLGRACRRLLHALYILELPTETVRRTLGLSTVQGVYYRRNICLEEAKKFLQDRLSDRS